MQSGGKGDGQKKKKHSKRDNLWRRNMNNSKSENNFTFLALINKNERENVE